MSEGNAGAVRAGDSNNCGMQPNVRDPSGEAAALAGRWQRPDAEQRTRLKGGDKDIHLWVSTRQNWKSQVDP